MPPNDRKSKDSRKEREYEPDEVLLRMLNTPPKQHETKKPKKKKKPAK